MARVEREHAAKESDDRRGKKYTKFRKDNRCRFCRDKVGTVDYKEIMTLFKLCTGQGKLYSRKRSGNCAYHQRSATLALRRARFLALVPYVGTGAL
ncbi:MAG: 30S ribosomal protein S18 [Planctomycetes bacterium]|nr:30S ribosomal protein S18 [Planctomycetota bacterium]